MTAARQAILIAAKDLRIEARSPHAMATVAVLGVLIVAALALGLGPGRSMDGASATAILWVAYLFGGLMCFESTTAVERRDDALSGLLAAPLDRGTLFVAKLLSNLVLVALLAVIVTPAGVVFFGFDLSPAPGLFVLIMASGLGGVAALGTLFSVAGPPGRAGAGLLAVLVLPLSLPVILISTQLMQRAFAGGDVSGGLAALVAFDIVMLVSGWLSYELLLEP
jgi:heme exporter protein B